MGFIFHWKAIAAGLFAFNVTSHDSVNSEIVCKSDTRHTAAQNRAVSNNKKTSVIGREKTRTTSFFVVFF